MEIDLTDESLKVFDTYKVGENKEYGIFSIDIKIKEPWINIKKDSKMNNQFYTESENLIHSLTIPEEEMFELEDKEYIITKKESKYVTSFYWIPLELVKTVEKDKKND